MNSTIKRWSSANHEKFNKFILKNLLKLIKLYLLKINKF